MALAVEELSLRYPGAQGWALRDVSFAVEPGEVLAVVGPSGSGKTSLLRLLCGLARPDAGRIVIGGTDVTGVAAERRPVAMVFQGFALFPHLSVRDNIAFGLRVRRTPASERTRRVAAVADSLRLTPLLDRKPGALSGGERQRTALARALVRDPVAFCLDEPLSSLDPVLRTASRRELEPLLRADGRCAVYVTHDQAEAMNVGDRVAVLNDGRLEQVGTPREVYDRPASAFVAAFIGDPPMSLLAARDGRAGPLRASTSVADGTLLGVRAEDVELVGGDDGEVVLVDDHGNELQVTVAIDAGTIVARTRADITVRVGDRVGLRVDPQRVHEFDAK